MIDYCVFVLSHGRGEIAVTQETLRKHGYTGEIFFVCDDEDETLGEYKARFGDDRVMVFSKKDYENNKDFDLGDNGGSRGVVWYARNACYDVAGKLGYRYFIEADDDYIEFEERSPSVKKGKYKARPIKNLDKVFSAFFEFLGCDERIKTIAFAQGGDFMGGTDKLLWQGVKRKAMNLFFCDCQKRVRFVGRINEDVNTYATGGRQGDIYLQVNRWLLQQQSTQKQKGGMSEAYLDKGTYLKSFYSVMYAPSCVKIAVLKERNARIHHNVDWDRCAVKIISGKWKGSAV